MILQNGTIIDGTGRRRFRADLRIEGDTVIALGKLKPQVGETVIPLGKNAIVAPGFMDAHSHADGGIDTQTDASVMVRQGITTAIVGQDGGSANLFDAPLSLPPTTINLASFVGHGTVRRTVLGADYRRVATTNEICQMRNLVARAMQNGAMGLSSGLEYEPGLYSNTDEIVALATVAGIYGGIYISHVRDEENDALAAFDEVIEIGERARVGVQISHIKLGCAVVWGKAGYVLSRLAEARKRGIDITADVYPYTYWQSGLPTLVPSDKNSDRAAWESALKEIGGPTQVRLSSYGPDASWVNKTLAEISQKTGKDAITLCQEIAPAVHSVVVTAMQESDLRTFIADPTTMFCTDGGLRPSHPRGAGSYPRILGHYVREQKLLSLEQAIRKASALPAERFGLKDRGVLAVGKKADIVVFDKNKILDTATVEYPASAPIGVQYVFVNGIMVLQNGAVSQDSAIRAERPGRILRR
jgi:N-acyl-D-amino-acid deacylase